jgi:hypothetical protein
MIEGQEVISVRLLCVEDVATETFLAQTCVCVFFIRSVSDIIFTMLFLPKPPADRYGPCVVRGPQFHKHSFTTFTLDIFLNTWFENCLNVWS